MAKTQEPQADAVVAEKQTPAQAEPVRTVDEWRVVKFPLSARGRAHADGWQHAAAAALHGWAHHAHHWGGPLTLTERDYDAALAAAGTHGPGGSPVPHGPAMGKR